MLYVPTNCGILTPRVFQHTHFSGSPDITQTHLPYFHNMICRWAYNIAQQWSWVVIIDAHNKDFLLNKIKSQIPSYEPPGWDISEIADATWTDETQNTIGCIFAQGVSIPGETMNIDRVGITEGSRRGYINAPIMNGRSDFESLQISFLETNRSFFDGVIRPWSIVSSHEGLIAKPRNSSIKADIYVYQLAKAGEDRPNAVRKVFTYFNCVPISASPEELTYNSNDYGKRQATFVFTHYTVDSGDKQSSYNSTLEQSNGDIPNEIPMAIPVGDKDF